MSPNEDLGVVLVFGGCGYVGSNLVKLLIATTSSQIHVMSRNPTKNLYPNVKYHAGDITDPQQVTELLEEINPQVIFDTVAPHYCQPAKELRNTSIHGTRVLLECAAQSKSVRAFVYTSTTEAVANIPGVFTEETAVLNTESSKVNIYGKTKGIADALVLAANDPPRLRTATLRVPPMYGEGNDTSMGTILAPVKKNQHKIQPGDNKRNFEFLYIEKACEAHILAAKALLREAEAGDDAKEPAAGKVSGEAFFITDGVPQGMFTFGRKIYAAIGYPVKESEITVVPYGLVLFITMMSEWLYWAFSFGTKVPSTRLGAIQTVGLGIEVDLSKAKQRLGYEPVADQDAVLKRVAISEAKRLGIEVKE